MASCRVCDLGGGFLLRLRRLPNSCFCTCLSDEFGPADHGLGGPWGPWNLVCVFLPAKNPVTTFCFAVPAARLDLVRWQRNPALRPTGRATLRRPQSQQLSSSIPLCSQVSADPRGLRRSQRRADLVRARSALQCPRQSQPRGRQKGRSAHLYTQMVMSAPWKKWRFKTS